MTQQYLGPTSSFLDRTIDMTRAGDVINAVQKLVSIDDLELIAVAVDKRMKQLAASNDNLGSSDRG